MPLSSLVSLLADGSCSRRPRPPRVFRARSSLYFCQQTHISLVHFKHDSATIAIDHGRLQLRHQPPRAGPAADCVLVAQPVRCGAARPATRRTIAIGRCSRSRLNILQVAARARAALGLPRSNCHKSSSFDLNQVILFSLYQSATTLLELAAQRTDERAAHRLVAPCERRCASLILRSSPQNLHCLLALLSRPMGDDDGEWEGRMTFCLISLSVVPLTSSCRSATR